MKTLILSADSFNIQHHIQVENEVDAITKILRDRQYSAEPLSRVNLAKIKDAFLHDINKEIRIFHYSGHAGAKGIELWNTEANGNSLAYAQELAAYIGSMKSVKMVILNGCSTMEQIQYFVQAGVPIVIATSRPLDDGIAQAFASNFYQHLLANRTLLEAFTQTISFIGANSELQTAYKKFRGAAFTDEEDKLPLYQLYPSPDSGSEVLKATFSQILSADFPKKEKKVFISYTQKDGEYVEDLEMHLAMLKRQKLIDTWNVGDMEAGADIAATLSTEMKTADIILLLVSARYLANPDIWDKQVTVAVERHNRKEAMLIPIILSPCEWKDTPFGGLVTLPRNGVVSKMDRDEAFAGIAKELKAILSKK